MKTNSILSLILFFLYFLFLDIAPVLVAVLFYGVEVLEEYGEYDEETLAWENTPLTTTPTRNVNNYKNETGKNDDILNNIIDKLSYNSMNTTSREPI